MMEDGGWKIEEWNVLPFSIFHSLSSLPFDHGHVAEPPRGLADPFIQVLCQPAGQAGNSSKPDRRVIHQPELWWHYQLQARQRMPVRAENHRSRMLEKRLDQHVCVLAAVAAEIIAAQVKRHRVAVAGIADDPCPRLVAMA